MLSLFATLLTQQRYSESDQVKTFLPNGATIYCERRESKYVSVQLILSSREVPDRPETYGYRHLIEHIVARSIPGHDREVEKVGGTLIASTGRDWMTLEWRLPAKNVSLAMNGIDKMIRNCGATPEAIEREAKIIGLEGSLSSSQAQVSFQAWKSVFGEEGIDSLGTEESVAKATPDDLNNIWRTMTKGCNVVMSTCGPIEVRPFAQSCRALLSGLATGKRVPFKARPVDGSFGSSGTVAVPVPPLASNIDGAAAALVAAFGLAGRMNQPFVTYTPSDRTGLALVGSRDAFESVKNVLDKEDPTVIFTLGRENALQWLNYKLSTPEGAAEINGQFLSLADYLRPVKLAESIRLTSYSNFMKSWNLMKEVAK